MRLHPLLMVLFLLLGATLLLVAGCGDDDDDDDSGTTTDDDDDSADDDDATDDDDVTEPDEYVETCNGGPEFAFDLLSTPKVVPYPNDFYRVADSSTYSGYRVQIDGNTALPMGRLAGMSLFSFVVDDVNTLEGFSTLGDMYMPYGEAEPNPSDYPNGFSASLEDGLFVMLDDPDSEYNGELTPITPRVVNGVLHLRPAYALRGNAHYVLVATRALRPKQGECYKASADMVQVWETYRATLPEKSDNDYSRYADSLLNLKTLGLDTQSILSIADFTTQDVTRGLNTARELMDELADDNPPVFKDWVSADTTSPHPNLQRFAFATLSMPVLQNAEGFWEFDAQGKPVVQGWQDVQVLFSLPKSTAADGQPFPVAVYGHGLGDTMQSLVAIADVWAADGFALAGMDFVCHGERNPIPLLGPTSSLLCYFDFLNPRRFRDNIRETLMNQMWFVRAIKNMNVDQIPEGGDSSPDYDTDALYYTAISLGAIQGGTFSAIEENINGWVMSSAGAKWTGIALEGPYMGGFVDIAETIDQTVPGVNATELIWLVGNLAQHMLDSCDPANFLYHTIAEPLPGMPTDRNVQVLQQGASEDFMIGGLSGLYYNRAGAWPQFEPFVEDSGFVDHVDLPYTGSGFYQYDTDEHFGLWDETEFGDKVRLQALHFLSTHYEQGQGEVIDPYAK